MSSFVRFLVATAVGFSMAVVVAATSRAEDDVAAFYKGRTIKLIIGGVPGGSYDLPGRVLAQHMGRHVPGNPAFVVENQAGAASLIMTNALYNTSPRDGSVIGMPNNNVVLEPRLKLFANGGGNVQFDVAKFSWLGTPMQEPHILFLSPDAPAKTLAELRQTKVIIGSVAAGATNHTLPLLVNTVFGTKFEMVTGYKGPPDIMLAMDRGEVQGISTVSSSVFANRPEWFEGKSIMIMQFGAERLAHVKNVPTAMELAPDADSRELLRFVAAKFSLARLLALPPGVPAERVAALRKAFDDTMKDADFIADAKKLHLDVDPVGAEDTERIIRTLSEMPQPIVDRLRPVLGGN